MKRSKIVNHFQKEGYPRRTIYDTLNRMQLGGAINAKNTGRPTSWTPPRKNQLKDWPITANESVSDVLVVS